MTDKLIKKAINVLAIITMLVGFYGMLFGFPLFLSARMEGFIGAILFGSGLLTFGVLNRNTSK